MRSALAIVLLAVVSMAAVPLAVTDGGSDAAVSSDVDNAVYCFSGTGTRQLSISPTVGSSPTTCSTSILWLIIADGDVTMTEDGVDTVISVSGASRMSETIARGATHTIVWTMPDGSEITFSLRVGSSSMTWTEDGTEDGGAWWSAASLDNRDRSIVIATTIAAIVPLLCLVAYYTSRKSEEIEDVV